MKIEVTGRHIEITDGINSHVESELTKLSNMFPDEDSFAHVVVDVEKNRQRAEIILTLGDKTLTANTTDKDLYLAISRAAQKIEKQALRFKDKRVARRQSAKKTAQVAPTPDGPIPAEPMPPRIISSETYVVKPMTPEEAVIRLEEDTNQFLVFRDAETEGLSVVYRRADGNYGLIQA